MKKNFIVFLSFFICFHAASQQIENTNGLLVFGGYNAYFIEVDTPGLMISPEYIADKIRKDTTLVVHQIPISMLDSIRKKSYSIQDSCKDSRGDLLFFPCNIEFLKYSGSKLVDANCIFSICMRDICGPFKLLNFIKGFKLKHIKLAFNSSFGINEERNKKRLTSWTPGLFYFENDWFHMKTFLIYFFWYLLIPAIATFLLFYSQKGKSGGDIAFLFFSVIANLLYHAILIVNLRLKYRIYFSVFSFSVALISSWLISYNWLNSSGFLTL